MWTLATTREIRKISIELIECLLSFGIKGQSHHGAIVLGPCSLFGWQQADIYVGLYSGFRYPMELGKGSQRDEIPW
jgi:hypothetical protein